jgi:hypothetical protein
LVTPATLGMWKRVAIVCACGADFKCSGSGCG